MSSASRRGRSESGISIQTVVIASLSSLAAAIVVHSLWKSGAIVGAAVTPVIVAVVSEALSRPAEKLTTTRDSSRRVPAERGRDVPAVSRQRGDDPFGLWEADRKRSPSRGRTWLVLGIVTGVIGFAIAAFVLTGTELVFGGSVTGSRNTTIFGGGSHTTTTVQSTSTSTTVTTVTRTAPATTVTQTVPAPAQTQTTATTPQQAVPQAAPETTATDPAQP